MPFPQTHRLVGQIFRFGMSTGFSALLSFGLPIVLHELFGVAEQIAVAVGFAAAYVLNILLLKMFVFRSKTNWRAQLPRYILANTMFRLLEYGAFLYLFERLGFGYQVSILCVLGVSAVAKFFVYKLVFDRFSQQPGV